MPSANDEVINLSRNHPPMIPDVFNREYMRAQDEVLAATQPSDIIAHHRWMGTTRDREGGAQFAAGRLGGVPDPGRIVVTNGTQSALLMIFAGVVGRGGVLVTEDLTYPPLLTFAKHFGFRIVGSAIDDDGLVPAALEETLRRESAKAIYVVPTHQNPTTSIMPLARRKEIARITRAHGVAIVEDDIYSMLTPDGPPPLSALAPELSWHVLGTAKCIAAGMKVAYVTAPSSKEAEARFWPGVRGTHWMSTPISAAVMTRMVENGAAKRIVDAIAVETRARQRLSRDRLGNIAMVSKPEALHLWFPLPEDLSRSQLCELAYKKGVAIGASDQYAADEKLVPNAVRIGIGNARDQAELSEALDRFAAAYAELRR